MSVGSDRDPVGDIAHQAPLSMEFSRQEYGVGCQSFLQGISLNPGIESGSPAFQADSSPPEPPGAGVRGSLGGWLSRAVATPCGENAELQPGALGSLMG